MSDKGALSEGQSSDKSRAHFMGKESKVKGSRVLEVVKSKVHVVVAPKTIEDGGKVIVVIPQISEAKRSVREVRAHIVKIDFNRAMMRSGPREMLNRNIREEESPGRVGKGKVDAFLDEEVQRVLRMTAFESHSNQMPPRRPHTSVSTHLSKGSLSMVDKASQPRIRVSVMMNTSGLWIFMRSLVVQRKSGWQAPRQFQMTIDMDEDLGLRDETCSDRSMFGCLRGGVPPVCWIDETVESIHASVRKGLMGGEYLAVFKAFNREELGRSEGCKGGGIIRRGGVGNSPCVVGPVGSEVALGSGCDLGCSSLTDDGNFLVPSLMGLVGSRGEGVEG
ncbi:hypothetical protein COLO4_33036 [Corchorus olitorius]|uniref:Uncharacterized protein n=1 Tax=Corchorus olitorius TaxID=93759 RepID=A0A1R3GX05_9ROSI|nr:hypothetical protein COLO4_33036 [Corchorus olitorius]